MATPIVPLSSLPPAMLKDYLLSQGESAEVIEWKYFDEAFNRGRERGYAWIRDGKMSAFMGMIPCTLGRGDERWEAEWLCDWSSADPKATPGMGIRLFKHMIAAHDHLLALGGNAAAQALHVRLATTTVHDAGIQFHLPLRLGGVVQKMAHRVTWLPPQIKKVIAPVPLRVPWKGARRTSVHCEPGVASAIRDLLETTRSTSWYPQYDWDYVDWQIGRSPLLDSWTCYVPSSQPPRAAALIWRLRDQNDFWRIVLWSAPGADDELHNVLSGAIRRVQREGGQLLSMLVSHRDAERIALLKSEGFIQFGGSRPLFLYTARDTSQKIDDFTHLSYLDTDIAYRF